MKTIHPKVKIGHVHLKVAELERALRFYRDVLGFEVTQRMGNSAAFLSAGGYHHHIGLNTWESYGGQAPAAGTTGLYHLAVLYPTRAELGDALRRLSRGGSAARWGVGPWGERGSVPARPGWEWRGALLGPAPGGVAAHEGWGVAMVTRPLDLRGVVGGGVSCDV